MILPKESQRRACCRILAPRLASAPISRATRNRTGSHSAQVARNSGSGTRYKHDRPLKAVHIGVKLRDEAPEFAGRALDALREPLEEGYITLGRAQGVVVYPAKVQLALTANPCSCQRPAGDAGCGCSAQVKRRYLRRISGPLLDRIDIQVNLEPVSPISLMTPGKSESSEAVASRVARARATATARWADLGLRCNAEVPGALLREPRWRLPPHDMADLTAHLDQGVISARGYDRVLRLAWTVADLLGRDRPHKEQTAELQAQP
ncbi:MAG TPA: hypothetical protein DGG94_07055 [Micromonosporaceae bacterium]|nr:hypothetical protein [Micromonosporaceae bacterium]